ncbi:hypothetical protein PC117_g18868 [Phytophthora cactorum]|uniref:Uncharacterized protein n=1 Tax=Phytophthora cactorum TaxID=29920 RepID=A0A8T1BX05_9STRA|nr:hypothetical protein PC117_g18868 [Phytophthora cactorum]
MGLHNFKTIGSFDITRMAPLWTGRRRRCQTRRKYKAMITRNRRERANAAKVRIGVKGKEEHEAIAEALQEGIATVEWQGSRFQMCQRHLLRRQRRGQCTLSLWKCPQSQALKATPEWLTQQLDDSDNEKWDKAYTVYHYREERL